LHHIGFNDNGCNSVERFSTITVLIAISVKIMPGQNRFSIYAITDNATCPDVLQYLGWVCSEQAC